jgi:hypothetical protein
MWPVVMEVRLTPSFSQTVALDLPTAREEVGLVVSDPDGFSEVATLTHEGTILWFDADAPALLRQISDARRQGPSTAEN